MSIQLLDAFAFFIFLANPEAFIHAAIMCSPFFPPGSLHFEKERLLWVQFPIILAVWYLMTG